MKLSRYRPLADPVGNNGGPAGADDGAHRHHHIAASASATSPDSSPREPGESELSASAWQPLPRSVLHLYHHVGTSPTTHFVPWASRAGEVLYSWRNRTSSPPWIRRCSLVGDVPVPPKSSTSSRRAPAQKPFVKWTHGDPRAHTPMLPARSRFTLANNGAPPPSPQSNQDPSHPPSLAQANKDCQGFLAQLAFGALVIMGVRDGLDDLLSGWNEALKVILVLSLIVGAGTLAAGLMATSPVVFTGYTRTVLSTCARFCTCLASFVLIVDLSVLMGSYGYIAGIMLGLVSVLFSVSVWILGEPDAYGVYMRARNGTKHLCRCFKWSRQSGPILPT